MTAAELTASFDSRQYRQVMGHFATGVAVLTVRAGDTVHASTVNSLTSVSLRPAMLLICLAENGQSAALVRSAGCFALTILGVDQLPVAQRLADRRRLRGMRQLTDIAHEPGRITGAPLLVGGVAFAECTVSEIIPAGDHEVVLGRVEEFAAGGGHAPLAFFGGSYGRFEPVRAADRAHEVKEKDHGLR